MPRRRRERRARTHDWQAIQQQTLWPEQEAYECLRPIVLFGETAASRAWCRRRSARPSSRSGR